MFPPRLKPTTTSRVWGNACLMWPTMAPNSQVQPGDTQLTRASTLKISSWKTVVLSVYRRWTCVVRWAPCWAELPGGWGRRSGNPAAGSNPQRSECSSARYGYQSQGRLPWWCNLTCTQKEKELKHKKHGVTSAGRSTYCVCVCSIGCCIAWHLPSRELFWFVPSQEFKYSWAIQPHGEMKILTMQKTFRWVFMLGHTFLQINSETNHH